VRSIDPYILPEPGEPLQIRHLSEKEDMELADALLENTNITYLELNTANYTKLSAEAMAKYVRTSKRLQRIRWNGNWMTDDRSLQQHEEMLCCFLPTLQECVSLKELDISMPIIDGPSNQALKNMLTHTQSLRSLTLSCYPGGLLDDRAVTAVSSGLKNNTSLRELTLAFSRDETNVHVSPILTSLRDHPLLRTLCLRGCRMDLTGLETLLLSNTSKITELDIHKSFASPPVMGLAHVLEALARRPTLTKLGLKGCRLGPANARLLRLALCNIPSLPSLDLTYSTLGSAELAEIAPALYRNTSIKVLDIGRNDLNGMESARLLRDILRSNKTMTALDLSMNYFGQTAGAVECIADGLDRNSALLKIDLSNCALSDVSVSILAQTLGSRNTTLQNLTLDNNYITSTGVGVLLETMEQNSHHITDLDLQHNSIGNEGASLLARSLGNNALPNLTRLSLSGCDIFDDGFITLVSALEQNTSLLYLDFCDEYTGLKVSGPFRPWRRIYQRSKRCNEFTLVGVQGLPLPCLCCW
jgi:Ran GTPase-activating protein (RanGAP) involved in mRNA processing and transport